MMMMMMMMQGKSMRLFGVQIFTQNPNEDGGGGNISVLNTTNSNLITNPNTHHDNGVGIHQHNSMATDDHHTKQVFKLFGKVISQLSTHNHHDHHDNHRDQRMINNNIPKPSRKRERSWSSCASTTTTASLPKKPKKERSPRPSKEEISKAHVTFPPLPPEIQQKMTTLGVDEKREPMLVLQKLVFKSDVDKQQARFLIPKGQLMKSEDEFPEDQEIKELNEEGEIKVKVIQQSVEVKDREMTLTVWPKPQKLGKIKETEERNTSVRYALQNGWNEVKRESSINEMDVVQVWAFRHGEKKKLGLALVNLGPLNTLNSKS